MPIPREISVEKRLSRSAVISWLPPEDQLVVVSQYHVCVDGLVKAVVPGNYKCKALIEELNLDKSVNISVRAVTEHGHSPDAACTISIGNGNGLWKEKSEKMSKNNSKLAGIEPKA